jgi:hypothetical protein
MNLDKLAQVLGLIEELNHRANVVLTDAERGDDLPIVGTKATGALRRTSMELTRALAGLRETQVSRCEYCHHWNSTHDGLSPRRLPPREELPPGPAFTPDDEGHA